MKTDNPLNKSLHTPRLLLSICALASVLIGPPSSSAQPFVGTNSPSQGTNFSFTLNAAATNLALSVSNTAASFSHLMLKLGGNPSDTDYDFIAQVNGQTNSINIQLPEAVPGTYGLRVRTPANSLTNAFRVTLATNLAGMRSASLPVSKPQAFDATGSLSGGQWHYFRIEVPTNSPGWRLVLNSANVASAIAFVNRFSKNLFDCFSMIRKKFLGSGD